METIEHQTLDMERALYGRENLLVKNCRFEGEADGESPLKECRNIVIDTCRFHLRYPFWHDQKVSIQHTEMSASCRAALWYCEDVEIKDTRLHGIKALRECRRARLADCDIRSAEFGWFSEQIEMKRCHAESEYFMMRASKLAFFDVTLKGKYSFQYLDGGEFENCTFDTKDAFWHAKHVTIKNSVLQGEYLAWYSQGLTLINCTIIGTQPFCYCRNLNLIDCRMVDSDLCFEKSEVQAVITTPVISIKNPRSGWIQVPKVNEIILDDAQAKARILLEEEACKEGMRKKCCGQQSAQAIG